MSKTLIIAEKPSVARDIAQALGGFKREGDYYESADYVLSSSVGHLLTLQNPDDVTRGKWSFAHLPAMPKKEFALQPADKKSGERLKMLVKLIKRKDVDAVINACDAGREGELIFRYILQYAKCAKPVQRLWLQSMTKTSIVNAFNSLRSDEAMRPLEEAARSRAEADWLMGINGTRAMTAFNSKDGGFFKTTVGRVQTPTLAIVCERDQQIRAFEPTDFWEVRAVFDAAAGQYEGRYINPAFKKDEANPHARESRLWREADAKAIVAAVSGGVGIVEETTKTVTSASPLLFDLTSLQRDANRLFGFSAKTTLSIAQALYEKHKVITYPRTDSRYLPQDYVAEVKRILQEKTVHGVALGHAPFAAEILRNNWVVPNKRIFNDAKVSDHFAIIPTQQAPSSLTDAELKVYDLVVKRFMAIFYPAAQYQETTRITTVATHPFKTVGKVLVSPGWLAVYGKGAAEGEEGLLVPVAAGERVAVAEVQEEAQQTKPPAHYTEATLLSAMEGAGKLVDDDELREALSERGLGTPATRATIIEGLINEDYLRREGRGLISTAKARQLMTLLKGLDVEELTSPELTGEWEHKLKQMEQGRLERSAFMKEIEEATARMVKRAKEYEHDTVPGDYITLSAPCPKCGGTVAENYRRFACTHDGCDFSISKHPSGRTFEPQEVEHFIREGHIGPLDGFISKMGRPFSAELKLDDEKKLVFDFGQDDEPSAPVDYAALTPLGPCPKCGEGVFDVGNKYACKKVEDKGCDFTVGKQILQQSIEPEQLAKLLGPEHKTDLLTQFISKRTGRPFSAFLVADSKGKVGFEFDNSKPKRSAGKKAAEAGSAEEGSGKTGSKTGGKTAASKTAAIKTGGRKTSTRKTASRAASARKTTASQ